MRFDRKPIRDTTVGWRQEPAAKRGWAESATDSHEAADRAVARGVRAMVGFTCRRTLAVTLRRDLIADGAVRTEQQVRAAYRQDWLVDVRMPLAWRLQKEPTSSTPPERH